MLDRLERHDDVDASVRQRQRGSAAFVEAHVGKRGVAFARMRHRSDIDVDPGYCGGNLCQQCAAVTFAARDVEYALPRDAAPRKCVAMPVLVGDLAGDAGDESLAGEFEVGGHSVAVNDRAGPRGR